MNQKHLLRFIKKTLKTDGDVPVCKVKEDLRYFDQFGLIGGRQADDVEGGVWVAQPDGLWLDCGHAWRPCGEKGGLFSGITHNFCKQMLLPPPSNETICMQTLLTTLWRIRTSDNTQFAQVEDSNIIAWQFIETNFPDDSILVNLSQNMFQRNEWTNINVFSIMWHTSESEALIWFLWNWMHFVHFLNRWHSHRILWIRSCVKKLPPGPKHVSPIWQVQCKVQPHWGIEAEVGSIISLTHYSLSCVTGRFSWRLTITWTGNTLPTWSRRSSTILRTPSTRTLSLAFQSTVGFQLYSPLFSLNLRSLHNWMGQTCKLGRLQ